jgi:hypothetical protein
MELNYLPKRWKTFKILSGVFQKAKVRHSTPRCFANKWTKYWNSNSDSLRFAKIRFTLQNFDLTNWYNEALALGLANHPKSLPNRKDGVGTKKETN